MVNRQVVLDTIKKMYGSGIEDSVVKQTLRDIGLAGNEIDSYIEEVKGKPAGKEGERGKSREEQK